MVNSGAVRCIAALTSLLHYPNQIFYVNQSRGYGMALLTVEYVVFVFWPTTVTASNDYYCNQDEQ